MTTTPVTILFVDDDPAVLLSVGDQLRMEGFDVLTAESGDEAMQILKTTAPDLIILDISMPAMSGLAFLKKISGEDAKPRYPVLVFTARSNMEPFFSETSVDGFLAKTSDPSALLSEVRRILLKHGKASPEHTPADRHRPKLLVIEDEPRVGARLRTFFSAAGYDITVLTSNAGLIEALQDKRPHVILLKEILPGVTGSSIAADLAPFTTACGISVILYDTSGLHPADAKFPNVDRFVSVNSPPELLKAVTIVFSGRA